MQALRSTLNTLRDRYAPVSHTSTFRSTGQITPEEFLAAGDFLVYKFPSWQWADAASPAQRVAYLPEGKQYLVTRGVPCHRRLDDNFAGEAGRDERLVRDGLGLDGAEGEMGVEVGEGGGRGVSGDEDDGWLRTGGMTASRTQEERARDVRTVDESGNVGEREEEEEIPDMEDEEDDDEAIIRERRDADSAHAPLRTYTLYITYTPYYRTPRLFLQGYTNSQPLPPDAMMQDIVGDYHDKTVTLEPFPFSSPPIKTVSIHPCKHASVMKVLLDRADAALKLRLAKLKRGEEVRGDSGMEGLVEGIAKVKVGQGEKGFEKGTKAGGGDEWEMLDEESRGDGDEEVAIRVDQYLVVFLKFMASVTPGIEHDFTMGV
ncbi:MAG: hypothetical protein Q9165_000315 [Trypethelium subeluteriae]